MHEIISGILLGSAIVVITYFLSWLPYMKFPRKYRSYFRWHMTSAERRENIPSLTETIKAFMYEVALAVSHIVKCFYWPTRLYFLFRKNRSGWYSWQGKKKICLETGAGAATSSARQWLIDIAGYAEEEIASHTHAPASIKYALRRGIPVFVIHRNREDSIRSIKNNRLGGSDWVNGLRYDLFWRYVNRHLDQINVYQFDTVTKIDGMQKLNSSKKRKEPCP